MGASPEGAFQRRRGGLNNKAKITMRKSYGFRTFRALELAFYHSLAKLPEPESTHDFSDEPEFLTQNTSEASPQTDKHVNEWPASPDRSGRESMILTVSCVESRVQNPTTGTRGHSLQGAGQRRTFLSNCRIKKSNLNRVLYKSRNAFRLSGFHECSNRSVCPAA